jgi:TRAP-type C4-dicarboxylate transport system permease large subunit
VPLVIYAILAEQNIAKLFAAAMIPGIIAMVGYMIAIAIYVRLVPGQAPDRRRGPREADLAPDRRHRADRDHLPGRLRRHLRRQVHADRRRRGRRRATFVAALLKREITWPKFKHCFYATAEASAMIFLIFIGADLMNSALALTQVPAQLASVVNSWGLSPLMVVVAVMLFYVVLGA